MVKLNAGQCDKCDQQGSGSTKSDDGAGDRKGFFWWSYKVMVPLKVGTIQDLTNSNTAISIDSGGRMTQPTTLQSQLVVVIKYIFWCRLCFSL